MNLFNLIKNPLAKVYDLFTGKNKARIFDGEKYKNLSRINQREKYREWRLANLEGKSITDAYQKNKTREYQWYVEDLYRADPKPNTNYKIRDYEIYKKAA